MRGGPSTRAIVVLGMHRSGTSALTRGLAALGVELGDDFLDTRPDNPTGYWEDKGIVDLDERVLEALGLHWEDGSPIEAGRFGEPAVRALAAEACAYVRRAFASRPLWGFKDPRVVRLLPFWLGVLSEAGVDDAYVVAIRHPLSVALSLATRQAMDAVTAHRLWLAYMVPYLRRIANKRFVVIDYDLLMADPRVQLERIAARLGVPLAQAQREAIECFAGEFLNEGLRHSRFSRHDFDSTAGVTPLTREAYLWLYELAADRMEADDRKFWTAWERVESAAGKVIRARAQA